MVGNSQPVDSQHPDRDVMIMSAIPQWVNEAEFKAVSLHLASSKEHLS